MADEEQQRRVVQKLRRELGTIVIDALDDPKTVEICLNTDGRLWVEKLGCPMQQVGNMTEANAEAMLSTLASALDTIITREKPILSGELPVYGARFEGLLPPIVSFPTFAIRKKASVIFTLEDYVVRGIMTEEHRDVLRDAVRDRSNILVVGGTGTGKTTLTNALIHAMTELTPEHRIIIMEDTAEIQCAAENKVFLRTSPSVTMQQLLRSCLRLRPDRILVGEVRDGAALDLLKAWGTGHPGGVSTIHANSAVAGLTRMEQLIAEVSKSPMQHLIADAVNLVVGIQKHQGRRFVEGIYMVSGFDNVTGRYRTNQIGKTSSVVTNFPIVETESVTPFRAKVN